MFRSLAIVPALAISFALPAAAQQLSGLEARQVAENLMQICDGASRLKDPAKLVAAYTDDAVRVTPMGETLVGKTALAKSFAGAMPSYDADPDRLDQVMVISNDVILVTGFWSGTWHGANGPVRLTGRWSNTDVRVGDTWKIAAAMASTVPQN